MAFATNNDFGQKFSLLKIYYKPKRFDYGIQGGATDLRTVTLDELYQRHLLGWNSWSRSNEGYDLARYFGTRVILYRHPHISYFFFWQRNWTDTEFERMPKLHPAWLMTHRKYRILVRSTSHSGKRKPRRIFIPPPALQTSTWYYQSSWCGVALFRWGITPVNLESPFVHKPRANDIPRYSYSLGYAQDNQQIPPLPLEWDYTSLGTGFEVEVMYRWWWDTGENNYMLVNDDNGAPKTGKKLTVVPIPYPYYVYFWGFKYPTAQHSSDQTPNTNPTFKLGNNPSPVALLWYRDIGVKVESQQGLFPNPKYVRPQDLPNTQKVWVLLTPLASSKWTPGSNEGMQKALNEQTVSKILFHLVGNSPFVVNKYDIPFQNLEMNFWISYSSHWQWGGTVPKPDTVEDPCDSLTQPKTLQVRNPQTVGNASLHPWDLTSQGLITDEKLAQILADTRSPPLHQQASVSREDSPRRGRKRRRERPPQTPSPSETSDEEEPPSSENSGSDSTQQSSQESEEETPTKKTLFLRKFLRLR